MAIQNWWFLFLLPFGSGLIIRLWPRRWGAWLVAASAVLIAFVAIWGERLLAQEQALAAVLGAVAAGALVPAGVEALEAALRQPRTWFRLAIVAGLVWGYYHPTQVAIVINRAIGYVLQVLASQQIESLAILALGTLFAWWALKGMVRNVFGFLFKKGGKKK